MIVAGMLLQAVAIAAFVSWNDNSWWLLATAMLGAGTAGVPHFAGGRRHVSPPVDRATSVGVYRTWRDAGYAVGAVVAGAVAVAAGFQTAIAVVATLTAISGLIVWIRMPPRHWGQ